MASLPCHTFDDWFEFYQKEPWGFEIETYRAAQVATILANGLFKPKAPYKHQDFIPNFEVETVSLEEKETSQASMWKARLNNDQNKN